MTDTNAPLPFERIELLDAQAFGKLVEQWTNDAGSRPTTIADFRKVTDQILKIPARINKDPVYCEWSVDNLVIRLPAPQLLAQSKAEMETGPIGARPYPLNALYEDIISDRLKGTDALYSRVGDYTIAQCV